MPNKLFSNLNSDFLVEGSKDKGYIKIGKGSFGDGKTSNPVSDYNGDYQSSDGWFEGKKGNKGFGEVS